jgi:NAD(P) transhydrogenase subunit alpha
VKIFVPKETIESERRSAMVPAIAKRLVSLGAELTVAPGIGETLQIPDDAYAEAGATVGDAWDADIVLRLRKPSPMEIEQLGAGSIHVSLLEPFESFDLIRDLAAAKVSAVAMELIPRTTIAQKMDLLSSQASLAGYVAVTLAAERLDRIFPMMSTPAGTIAPARVFIIGAGVAGLQAIATAKRLGARVEAFDTRPVVKEQVESIGAKFLEIDLGETGQTRDGYARELTEAQLAKQREAMARSCAGADVVITTAQVFGRKAPLIINEDMVAGMKPGAVIVDLAAETGGNVAGTKAGEEVLTDNGVRILGQGDWASRVPVDASQMVASNLFNFVDHFWAKPEGQEEGPGQFELNRDDEIIAGSLVTHDGEIVNETVKQRMNEGNAQ